MSGDHGRTMARSIVAPCAIRLGGYSIWNLLPPRGLALLYAEQWFWRSEVGDRDARRFVKPQFFSGRRSWSFCQQTRETRIRCVQRLTGESFFSKKIAFVEAEVIAHNLGTCTHT